MTSASARPSRRAAIPRSRSLTVIFKGSNRCNAKCTYCSVGKAGARIITADEFEVVAQQLEALCSIWKLDRLEFTFHGGEPTLLGSDLIDRACTRIGRIPVRTGFSMQSNLLDVRDGIMEVVRKHGITLGSSIDPISAGRLDARGRDAFPTWLDNYIRVAGSGTKAPGGIFVVTRMALGHAEKLIETALSIFKATKKRFGLQINPVYAQGRAAKNQDVLISPEEFGRFMIEIWEAWEPHREGIRLSPIQDFVAYFDPQRNETVTLSCSFGGRCARSHVGIDFDLNVAGCGRRLDSKAFMGNLKEASLVEILDSSEEIRKLERRTEALEQGVCAGCRFFEICKGGCPDDADLAFGDIMKPFEWCESYRMLFEAMEARYRHLPKARPLSDPRSHYEIDVTRVSALIEPSAISSLEDHDLLESIWLMPTSDGRALRFDSALHKHSAGRRGRLRIWVHNRHVPSLALWEDILRSGSTSVVLFEREGLEKALDILNDLAASFITLDIPTILASEGGGEALNTVLDRYLLAQEFTSQVFPFSRMMLATVNDLPTDWMNRWGLRPGGFDLEVMDPKISDEGYAKEVIRSIHKEESYTMTEWLSLRPSCKTCELARICSGCLAPGDGGPCSSEAMELVRRVKEVGDALKTELVRIEQDAGSTT